MSLINIDLLVANATPAQLRVIAERKLVPIDVKPGAYIMADGVIAFGDPLTTFTIQGLYSYNLIPIEVPERTEEDQLRELIKHGETAGGNFAKLAEFAKRLLPSPTTAERQGETK